VTLEASDAKKALVARSMRRPTTQNEDTAKIVKMRLVRSPRKVRGERTRQERRYAIRRSIRDYNRG
jgi:hypothetical protein